MTSTTDAPVRYRFLRTLTSRASSPWSVRIAAAFLVLLVLVAIFAPLVAPYDPDTGSLGGAYQGSSLDHLLGTDASGRDILSRLIYGARYTLLGAILIVGLATVIGVGLAVVAAWKRRSADAAVVRAFDTILVLPALLLALAATALFGAGLVAAGIALAIAYVPYIGRVTRASALQQTAQPYIAALRLQGFRASRVIGRHLLPNLAGLVMAQITVLFGYAIIDMAAVSYLGLGVQPPTADWGSMVASGQSSIVRGFPEESLYAGLAIFFTVFAFNILGDYLGKRFNV
jgi:peptide/nickel transport system permease protein